MALAEALDLGEVALLRHGKAVGGGDRLHDDRGRIARLQRVLHRIQPVEGHLDELAEQVLGEEGLREALVAGLHRQARVPVVGLDDRHDLAPLRRVARGLDRELHRLRPARPVDGVLETGGRALRQRLRERGARERGKVVVAHVEALRAGVQHLDELRIAVPEVVGAAVQVDVDEAAPVHVVEAVALAPVDHQVDARVLPELRLVRVPPGLRRFEELELRFTHGSFLRASRQRPGISRSRKGSGILEPPPKASGTGRAAIP